MGFRVAEYRLMDKLLEREHQYYDISVSLFKTLGFLGVDESYFGLQLANPLGLVEKDGLLLTQPELDGEYTVTEIEDPFLAAYLLRTYLLPGYEIYEGKSLVSPTRRVVLLHKLLHLTPSEGVSTEPQIEVECTLYFGDSEAKAILAQVSEFSLYPSDVANAAIRGDGSVTIRVKLDRVKELLSAFGGVYSTTSVWHLFLYFTSQEDQKTKGRDAFCYAPKTDEILWERTPEGTDSSEARMILDQLHENLLAFDYVVL